MVFGIVVNYVPTYQGGVGVGNIVFGTDPFGVGVKLLVRSVT